MLTIMTDLLHNVEQTRANATKPVGFLRKPARQRFALDVLDNPIAEILLNRVVGCRMCIVQLLYDVIYRSVLPHQSK